jgi:gas vesicle protein
MSEYDEGYVIIERRTGNFGTFVWGMLLGAAAALLFAPKSGRETRRELSDSVYRLRDQAEDKVREVQDAVTDTVEDVRRQFEDGIDTARRAVESGKEAARASREEVERQMRQSSAAFRSGFDAARAGSHGGDLGSDQQAEDTSHDPNAGM